MLHQIARNLLLLIFLAGFLASCSTTWKGPDTVKASDGTSVCAKHHTSLATKSGYRWDVIKDPPDVYWKIQDKYPNLVFLAPEASGVASILATEQYCPSCQSEYEGELRRKNL
jgi:hypothetical protein